ncbi:gallidermin/nisin family lantibiotic [Kitasatospora sp. NPDC059795]|uniref:gallidermin/nisin family lantibiotic n=1 Tax=Kitasatospora sp. NPDC059795 TaxID=3346949 RepID=UPI0036675B35
MGIQAMDQGIKDFFELDAQIEVETEIAGPNVTSLSLCTPGCTSPNGGSACSYCC